MKLKLFNLLIYFWFSVNINAQVSSSLRTVTFNGARVLTTPDIFNTWLTNEAQKFYTTKLLSTSSLGSTNDKPWCIYSDRSRNPILTVQGAQTGKSLQFMQPIWVSDVYQQKLLEVFGYEPDATGTPVFKKLGYVNKEKVLLSSYSSLNEYGASRHAMICYALRGDVHIGDDVVDLLDNKNRFYLTPNEQDDQGIPEKFKIYFVLKEVNNVVLLSTKDQISESDKLNRNAIPGWIKSMLITPWDHKICLEPNTGSKIEPYKRIDGVSSEYWNSAPIFGSIKSAESVDYSGILDSMSKNDMVCKWTLKSYKANHFRLPIVSTIGSTSDNKRRVASLVTKIGDDVGSGNSGTNDDLIRNLENQIKTVNVLIVIDGSKSMENYFNSVARSLSAITQNMKASGFTTVKVGVAIYRDLADATYPSLIDRTSAYKRDYEFVPLTTDINSIEMFLKESAVTMGNINSVGVDRFESLFRGLKRAIVDTRFNEKESNFMLLVGDCGNHPNDNSTTINELSDLIARYNINIQAFQVNYNLSSEQEKAENVINPYLKFRKDIATLIKESTKKRLESHNKKINKTEGVVQTETYKYEMSKNFINSDEINLYKGNVMIPFKIIDSRLTYTDQIINENDFTQNTKKSINNYFASLTSQLAEMQKTGMRKSNVADRGKSEITYSQTIASLRGADEKTLEALRSYGTISIIGYALMEYYNTGAKAFRTVVFISLQEKQAIVNRLVDVIQKSGAGSEKRSNFKKAITELVGAMMGQNDNVVIEQMSLSTIWEKTLGVKFSRQYEAIGNIPIGKLDQNSVLSDREFEEFYTKFKAQVDQFRNYRESSEDGGIGEIGGQKILWIPTRVFPMCDYE
jgi:hypothetical protein